ncbi:GlsB/YeaQ/YmgE family stress response membrane protein [Phormidium tenue FACHB-886]|nr:GlsB/YeaQ/YmgE family stress response membrane protein [Phormidium tenue FACHB-886]
MSVLAWVLLGLIAAALARVLNAGGNVFTTNVLGILGAIAGGYFGKLLLGVSTSASVLTMNVITSGMIGAMIALVIWGWYTKRA